MNNGIIIRVATEKDIPGIAELCEMVECTTCAGMTTITSYGWEQAGITYNRTLSYVDHARFLWGTCHEYPALDPVKQETVKLRIRPLIAMVCTLLDPKYLGLTKTTEAYDAFMKLKDACKAVGSTFTLLWYNAAVYNGQRA